MLDEAIERISDILIEGFDPDDSEDCAALKLGIEALKEVRASREEDYIGDTGLLPGETE